MLLSCFGHEFTEKARIGDFADVVHFPCSTKLISNQSPDEKTKQIIANTKYSMSKCPPGLASGQFGCVSHVTIELRV